ncbi:hypothetical protein KCU62_g8471, partial [Aureobasidium sp. EXF-3399]
MTPKRKKIAMSSSDECESPEPRKKSGKTDQEMRDEQLKREEEWRRNTWNARQVTYVISSSADMIKIVSRGSGLNGTLLLEEPEDVLQLYMFADQKKLLALRRSIMSKIVYSSVIEKHDGTPYIGHLSEGCGLFRYMADLWASEWRGVRASYVVQTLNEYQGIPRVFLYEVMRKLATIHDQKESEVAIPNPCNYHEHEDDSEWHTTCGGNDCDKPDDNYYYDDDWAIFSKCSP